MKEFEGVKNGGIAKGERHLSSHGLEVQDVVPQGPGHVAPRRVELGHMLSHVAVALPDLVPGDRIRDRLVHRVVHQQRASRRPLLPRSRASCQSVQAGARSPPTPSTSPSPPSHFLPGRLSSFFVCPPFPLSLSSSFSLLILAR